MSHFTLNIVQYLLLIVLIRAINLKMTIKNEQIEYLFIYGYDKAVYLFL